MMHELINLPLEETSNIQNLRNKVEENPKDNNLQIDLGIALSNANCTYEAAIILRPLRSQWKSSDVEQDAKRALDAQSWWNKNWKDFVALKNTNQHKKALELLGTRHNLYWDLPPLLVHLADISLFENNGELAQHLYQRVFVLSKQGLPKMNMQAFEYISQAGLIETLLRQGKTKEALKQHSSLKPNQGNVMGHEILGVRLLVANKKYDEAMKSIAHMLTTAQKKRSDYGKVIRIDFIENAKELSVLRQRHDWLSMLDDPVSYLQK